MERCRPHSIAKNILLGVTVLGAAVSLSILDGRNSQSIDAAGSIPTPSPLPTNTLELTATKIPIAILTPTILPAWQTVTVAAGQLRKEQDQVSAEQTLSAINTQRARLVTSPTLTATSTESPKPTRTPNILATQAATDKAVEQELTDRRETATAKAVQTAGTKTSTVVAAKPTSIIQNGSSDEGGPPWICIVDGVLCLVPLGIGAVSAAAITGATAGYAATGEGRGRIRWTIAVTRQTYNWVSNFIRSRRTGGGNPPTP